jgi:hypothetical protein
MKKHLSFKKWRKVLTPSGLWDNGLYEVGGSVTFPADRLKNEAIIETKRVKIGTKNIGGEYVPIYVEAFAITLVGNKWTVVEDPNFELIMLNPHNLCEFHLDTCTPCPNCELNKDGSEWVVVQDEVKCNQCGLDIREINDPQFLAELLMLKER